MNGMPKKASPEGGLWGGTSVSERLPPGGGRVEGDKVELVRDAGVGVELDEYASLAEVQGVGATCRRPEARQARGGQGVPG